jgi:O-antigen/teichoic acid export membrane protein
LRYTRSRLIAHTAAYGTAGVVAKAAALATVPILTRALGSEAYGLADIAASLAAVLTLIGRFGGEIPAARQAALVSDPIERERVLGVYVSTTALVSTVVAAAFIPLVGVIASLWGAPEDVLLPAMALLLVPIGAIQLVLVSVVRLEGLARATVVLSTLDLLAQMALAVVFVLAGLGPYGVLLGYIAGSVVGLAGAAVKAAPLITLNVDWRRTLTMVRRGVPYLPVYVSFVLADQVARLLTVDTLGADELGHLALAFRISGVVALAAASFSLAWGPLALQYKQTRESAQVFGNVLVGYTAVSLAACLALGSLAPELVTLLGGPAFIGAATVVPTLVWAAALAGTFFVVTTAAGITDRGWSVAGASVTGAIVQVVASVLLIAPLGIAGLGVGAVGGRLIALGLLWLGVRDFLGSNSRRVFSLVAAGSVTSLVLQDWVSMQIGLGIRLAFALVALCALGLWGLPRSRPLDGGTSDRLSDGAESL